MIDGVGDNIATSPDAGSGGKAHSHFEVRFRQCDGVSSLVLTQAAGSASSHLTISR